jgi:hypothetical protein
MKRKSLISDYIYTAQPYLRLEKIEIKGKNVFTH